VYADSVPEPVHIQAPDVKPTLPELADEIADKYGISRVTLENLVEYESGWDPTADNGYDRGLTQINRAAHPDISDAQAFDSEFALTFAAKAISNGTESQWTVCNCYSLVKSRIKGLPHMADIIPNESPRVGAVAIFHYGSLKHVAIVTKMTQDGFFVYESNYSHCVVDTRYVPWNSPNLDGFWGQDGG